MMNGFLLIDKPAALTSFSVVKRVKGLLGVRKIGHCGTLDPLATGLLILCVGKATKLAQFVSNESKSYEVDIVLGWESTTYDGDGELTEMGSPVEITISEVEDALAQFRGRIRQRPPIYSAIKYRGRPLYKYARENQAVTPAEREITIDSIEIRKFASPHMSLRVSCSKGTYIRSLAHDLGKSLGCGGYVEALRRTGIGRFTIDQAVDLDTLSRVADPERLLLGVDDVVTFPSIYLTEAISGRIGNGVEIRGADIFKTESPIEPAQIVAIRSHGGDLLAVGRTLLNGTQLHAGMTERAIEYIRVI